jgi:hypothetical protein
MPATQFEYVNERILRGADGAQFDLVEAIQ